MSLASTATDLLADIAIELADLGRTVPTRQFVTVGEIVDECDQLAIGFQGMYLGLPGVASPGIVTCQSTVVGQMEVRLTKCWPTDNPTPGDLSTAAVGVMLDAQALQQVIFSLAPPNDWAIQAANIVGPSGGVIAISVIIGILSTEGVTP